MPISRKQARSSFIYGLVLALFILSMPAPLPAYSVLTHEQVVDFLWHSDIVKLLRERYPDITPEQLREAHAYAYGGSLIQDMGYYPAETSFLVTLCTTSVAAILSWR